MKTQPELVGLHHLAFSRMNLDGDDHQDIVLEAFIPNIRDILNGVVPVNEMPRPVDVCVVNWTPKPHNSVRPCAPSLFRGP